MRALVVGGFPLLHWSVGDVVSESHAKVTLVRMGFAGGTEVARAFGCSRMTVHRAVERFEEKGLLGLVPSKRGPKEARVLGEAAILRGFGTSSRCPPSRAE